MLNLIKTIRNQIPLTAYSYKGEAVSCNLCGSSHSLTICKTDRRLKQLRTVSCEQCGLIRTDPMPTDAELAEYYAGEYRFDYQFALKGAPPRFHQTRSQREAEARFALLKPVLSHSARLLDFGSGSGEFLGLAARAGLKAQGLEPGESFAAHARKAHDVTVETGTWQQVQYPASSFDIITANHVLEHLREPVSALRQLANWLAEDGVIHVSVPNAMGARERSFHHFHFAHVHNFMPQTLLWTGMVAGLEPDPRFRQDGTTIVFRKRKEGAATPQWPEGEGARIAARFEQSSALGFLVSGRWALDAIRRFRKVLRDSAARPAARPAHRPAQPGKLAGSAGRG
jgi:2-polyprenyl-3-methyl-5-hydroxy-6-metoxy-1,4-benzoquinol methylase